MSADKYPCIFSREMEFVYSPRRITPILIFSWRLPVPNFFVATFLSFFSALLLSPSFAFHILSGCRRKLGVNKPGNGTLINYRYNGPFYNNFCTKTDNHVFKFATSECRQYPKPTSVRIDLS